MKRLSVRSRRIAAPAVHLLVSLCVSALASIVVFAVWYPPPYAAVAAGTSLFLLLVSVDVVLGPALTAIAANPAKPAAEFKRDLMIIAAVQIAALAYGLYSISLARPVYLAFEVDRFHVVTAADIDHSTLAEAPPGLAELPWTGPKLIAAAKPTKPEEILKSIDLALGGFDISLIPRNWRDYSSQQDAVWRVARPVDDLRAKYPTSAGPLAQIAVNASRPVEALRFLPVQSRQASWVALIAAPDARIVGFLPLDGFF